MITVIIVDSKENNSLFIFRINSIFSFFQLIFILFVAGFELIIDETMVIDGIASIINVTELLIKIKSFKTILFA